MHKTILFALISLSLVISSCNSTKTKQGGPAKVELRNENGKYLLYVNSQPFFAKGAGLEFGNIEALAKHGANSFRTWRTENGKEDAAAILDKAQKEGLMVLMGLEVGRERHGYNYGDTGFVNKQFRYLKGEVMRLKDHPALLGWAIGNELNLFAEDLRVYDAVNDLSKMIHEVDPNHVTTTTFAGIGKREIDYIKEHCTDIDFICIQMYGDIVNLQQRISDAGWDGPYMVTEWGATGHWEVDTTSWGAYIEQTSHEKAVAFTYRYKLAIEADSMRCLGSYVFLWGQKQERTPTWYGMFLETGEETETVDAMHAIWTGNWPENRCPVLDSLRLNNKVAHDNIIIKPGTEMKAIVASHDPDNDTLVYVWEILPESTATSTGGDFEERPASVLKNDNGTSEYVFKAPEKAGEYRLFSYVLDKKGYAATANIPFLVK